MSGLSELYRAFFKIGLFLFGGGYAMLPLIEREIVTRRNWVTRGELLDYFAIGQCTPGIISVNTATLVGYKRHGFWGALSATAGLVTPAFIIIMAIAAALGNFAGIPAVVHAFAGIRIAVAALIAASVVNLLKSNVLQTKRVGETPRAFARRLIPPLFLCAAAFALTALIGISPVYVTVAVILVGAAFYGKAGEPEKPEGGGPPGGGS